MGAALLVSFAVSVRNFDPIDAVPSGAWTASVLALGSMVLVATVAGGACGSRGVRGVVCVVAAALAALLLPMPEWRTADARMLLAFALAASSALLLPPGMHRGGFSFWCAQSVALAACSVLALSVGFAKLALPVGAASAVCGWIGVLAIFTRPHRVIHAGISGSIAIAGIAGLAAATAFAFETGAQRYASGIERMLHGSPSVASFVQASAGYELLLEVGTGNVRAWSQHLTERLRRDLLSRGFELHSPEVAAERGGTLTVRLSADENGPAFVKALEAQGILVDHRPGAGIRVSPHYYTLEDELDEFAEALVALRGNGRWREHLAGRTAY